MNRKTAIALVLASAAAAGNAVAGTALAGDITIETTPFVSSVSRADVQAEFLVSRNQVAAATGEDSGSAQLARNLRSAKTRAEVTAEFLGSRDQVAAFTREDSGSAYLARNAARGKGQAFAGQPRAAH